MAVLALVGIEPARRQLQLQYRLDPALGGRSNAGKRLRRNAQIGQQALPGMLQRSTGMQPHVRHDELQHPLRAHRRARHVAAEGVHTAGHIQREHRCRGGIDGRNQSDILALRGARQADAIQGIHDQVGLLQTVQGHLDVAANGQIVGTGALRQSAAWCRVGQVQHTHLPPGLAGMTGQHVTVAAIVARPTHHHDAPRLGPMLQHAVPGRQACTLHQHIAVAAQGSGCLRVDATCGGDIKQFNGL